MIKINELLIYSLDTETKLNSKYQVFNCNQDFERFGSPNNYYHSMRTKELIEQ